MIWYFLVSSSFTYVGMHVLSNLPRNVSRKKILLWMIGILILIWLLFVRFDSVYSVIYGIILLHNIGTLLDFKKRIPTIFSYFTYVSCFPNLLLGPVLSYFDMEEELKSRRVTKEDFSDGVFSLVKGIGIQAILITFLSMCLDGLLLEKTILSSFVVIILTMLQVVLWFRSYFEISFGLSRMLGFHFEKCVSILDLGIFSWFKRYCGGFPKWVWFLFSAFLFGMNWNVVLWFLILAIVGTRSWLFLLSFVLLVQPSVLDFLLGFKHVPISNFVVNYEIRSYLLMILISFGVVLFGQARKRFSGVQNVFYVVLVFLILIFLVSGTSNSIWAFMI